MKRHFDSQHKGKDVKYKMVADGCKSLKEVWVKKDSGQQVLKDESPEGNDGDAEEEMPIEQGVVAREEGVDLGIAEKESMKRRLQDFESDEEDVNMNARKKSKSGMFELLLEKISNMEASLEGKMANIDKKVDAIKEEIDEKGKAESCQKKTEDPQKRTGDELELMDDIDLLLERSKSVAELESVLVKIGVKKESDVDIGTDGYFCGICHDGSKPNWKCKDKVAGVFRLEKGDDVQKSGDENQSRQLRNLKSIIKAHFTTKTHNLKKEILKEKTRAEKAFKSRQRTAGMNVFRERYLGIKQSKSRVDFEEDMLRAKLNGTEVGDKNHSRFFAKNLDNAIHTEMKARIKEKMGEKLDATGQKRPAGLLMDKMTPRKRTGQMHAVVVGIPENSLSQVSQMVKYLSFLWHTDK